MYSIIDIETTGGNQPGEKITEIAIYVHNGKEIIDSFHTLINPERSIPYNITRITGIDDGMVVNSPKFYEVAKKIIEITQNTIFVAHNVHFDYNFIKREFKELGFEYVRPFVCTVKLSRQILPGHASYSLGKICADLAIHINGRHRADGDALATVKLFEILLATSTQTVQNQTISIVTDANEQPKVKIDNLPEATGVYYLKNLRNELIYIGKSRNIRKRVNSHLSNASTKKAIELRQAINTIEFEETGSEIIALLKETIDINKCKPLFNKVTKIQEYNIGLFTNVNKEGYITFSIKPTSIFDTPILKYINTVEATEELFHLVNKFNLCPKLSGLQKNEGACVNHGLKNCHGACIGNETTIDYNLKATQLIQFIDPSEQNFIIIDKGRHELEKSIVHIVNNTFIGFGYIATHLTTDQQALKACIIPEATNKGIIKVIKSFLAKHKVEQVIYLK
jgi:DNA polymerase-3 subunit epsilon